jgi:hypothetical protein
VDYDLWISESDESEGKNEEGTNAICDFFFWVRKRKGKKKVKSVREEMMKMKNDMFVWLSANFGVFFWEGVFVCFTIYCTYPWDVCHVKGKYFVVVGLDRKNSRILDY